MKKVWLAMALVACSGDNKDEDTAMSGDTNAALFFVVPTGATGLSDTGAGDTGIIGSPIDAPPPRVREERPVPPVTK